MHADAERYASRVKQVLTYSIKETAAMIKKHKWSIIAVAVSIIATGCTVWALAASTVDKHDAKITSDTLLESAVTDHTKRLSKNDSRWERDLIHEAAQDKRIDGTEKMQVALQRDQAALLTGQSQIRQQQLKDAEFKVDIVRELGELSGHIKSITHIAETP